MVRIKMLNLNSKLLRYKTKLFEKIAEKGISYSFRRLFTIIFYNIIGLLAYPVCLLLNIRFIPVYVRAIGHLCVEPDCYIKEGLLGLRPDYKSIILAPSDKVVNMHILSYWKPYFRIINSRLLCSILAPLTRNKFTTYDIFSYVFAYTSIYPQIQKKYADRSPLLALTETDRKRGWTCLQKIGLSKDDWFVCVHCREDGYLGNVDQNMRNGEISSYFLAMDDIIKRGGWVFRMGDSTMKSIGSKGHIIDYAHLDIKSDWMDIFLCASCKFFLGSNSGLYSLSAIFGVPSAIANYCPIGPVLPYGVNDVGIPKLIESVKERRYLKFREILDSEISHFRLDSLYSRAEVQAIDNAPEDIRDLAIEMLDKVEDRLVYTVEDDLRQDRFKSFMNSSHYSFGAKSRVGRDFLRKYEFLLND